MLRRAWGASCWFHGHKALQRGARDTRLPQLSSLSATGRVAASSEGQLRRLHTELQTSAADRSDCVTLRPYQQDAIDACLDALRDGKTRIGVSSPTGSGKTTIFTHLIPLIEAREGTRGHVLILVGNIELANQAVAAVRRFLPDLTVELEQGKNSASGFADVTIATYQTMNNQARRQKFDPLHFKLVIVDEAHHAAANSYLRLLNFFNRHVVLPADTTLEPHANEVPIVGFSATFSRPDQLALNLVFEEIVFHQEVSHMLREGWLSPARVTSLKVDLKLDTVELGRDGDFASASLAAHVNTPKINSMIVGVYLDQIVDRRSTLVFCVDLGHVTALTNAFRAAGVDARVVSSKTRPADRRQLVQDFRAGRFPVLVNCEIFTEGTDIPEIDSIILARPTRSRNLLTQMVGRGLRLSPDTGKIDCRLIDVLDNVGRVNGMVTVPTLFGLSLEEKEAVEREDGEKAVQQLASRREIDPKRVTFVDHDDPFGVDQDAVPVLQLLSPNAWVACGGGKYILELMFGRGYVSIQQESTSLYSIVHVPRLPEVHAGKSPNARPVAIAQAPTLERAVQSADAFVARRVSRDMAMVSISRRAPWRKRPPSDKQLAALRKMKGLGEDSDEATNAATSIVVAGHRIQLGRMNGGQVAACMTAAKHGALGRRAKVDKATAKADSKLRALEEKRLAAEARAVPFSKRL